jgi:hypothetical protein
MSGNILDTGAILWRGCSELDSAPIVVIATGLGARGSRNAKTGAGMVQLYILRADQSPIDAARTGADASICGDCRHRGTADGAAVKGRTCYVNLAHGPRMAYLMATTARYDHVDLETAAEILRGRVVRLGAYGDPAAVPFSVWQALLTHASAWTGYTHQWARYPELAAYCMASVDTPSERAQARMLGFRTFRVRAAGQSVDPREVVCPASKEAGHKTTCDACRACGGNLARARADIVIAAHGIGAGAFNRAAAQAAAS